MAGQLDMDVYLKHCKGEFEDQTKERRALEKKINAHLNRHEKHLTEIIYKLNNGLTSTVERMEEALTIHIKTDDERRQRAEEKNDRDKKWRFATIVSFMATLSAILAFILMFVQHVQ